MALAKSQRSLKAWGEHRWHLYLKNDQRYFQFTVANPIAYCGRCIVIGSDEDGGNDDVKIDIDVLTKQIEWLPEGYNEEPYMEFIPLN